MYTRLKKLNEIKKVDQKKVVNQDSKSTVKPSKQGEKKIRISYSQSTKKFRKSCYSFLKKKIFSEKDNEFFWKVCSNF